MSVGSDLRKAMYKQTEKIAVAIGELSCPIEELDVTEVNELSKLQNENAKLRERVDAAHMSRLLTENENAKLRELVKRMFDRVNYECRCCSVFCSDWDEDNECCVFTTLMCELGVDE